mgnify:CR=1 FL=1|tara:strand:+ start:1451 stop:1903 length:453 start_codon:yes stop_codon:yes gene_type:complete
MANQSVETRLAIVENDIKAVDGVFTKLDTSIEKITELNVSIREVLSVHEQRISTNEDEIERIDSVFDGKYEQLHSRITAVQRELSSELQHDTTTVMGTINDLRKTMLEHGRQEEDRIRSVERRQWVIMGAAAALGFLLGNTNLISIISGG